MHRDSTEIMPAGLDQDYHDGKTEKREPAGFEPWWLLC